MTNRIVVKLAAVALCTSMFATFAKAADCVTGVPPVVGNVHGDRIAYSIPFPNMEKCLEGINIVAKLDSTIRWDGVCLDPSDPKRSRTFYFDRNLGKFQWHN